MLAAVTCHFNFAGFRQPKRNLLRFARLMRSQGVPLYGIELYLKGTKPVMSGRHGWSCLEVGPSAIMWQKEKLINAAVQSVPEEYKHIAWLDCDIHMANPNWAKAAVLALRKHKIVQLFNTAAWALEDGDIGTMRKSCVLAPADDGGHAGFAWAARREFFERYGLYDKCIAGSGDIACAAAFLDCGVAPDRIGCIPIGPSYGEWRRAVRKWLGNSKIACIDNVVTHEWHGKSADRGRAGRPESLAGFVPPIHLIDRKAYFAFAESCPSKTVSLIRQSFERRKEDGAASRPRVVYEAPGKCSVVMVTHPGYADRMRDVMASIESQSLPLQKILSTDGMYLPPKEGWTIVTGEATGNPNIVRNAGLCYVNNDWVIVWDGDNIMPPDYAAKCANQVLNSNHKTGFIYPHIRWVNDNGVENGFKEAPEWDYWLLRENAFVDTSSLWRTDALRDAGGFSPAQVKFDDYELALRMSRRGWEGLRSGVAVDITQHDNRRSRTNDPIEALWTAYDFTVLIMLSSWRSNNALARLYEYDLPPNAKVLIAAMPDMTHVASTICDRLGSAASWFVAGKPWVGIDSQDISRHQHVCSLYNNVLPRINTDMVMIIEDDNIGPANGIRMLMENMKTGNGVAGTAGCYRSKANPDRVCASFNSSRWESVPYDDLERRPYNYGMLGGGFTLYRNSALKKALPCRCTINDGRLLGWDANLGKTMRRLGYSLVLDARVEVGHDCKEVREHLASKEVTA